MRAVVTSQVSRNQCSEAPRGLQLCILVFECLLCIQQRKVTTNTRIVQRSMRQVTGDTSSCISKLQSSKKSTWFGDVLWCGAWMVHPDPTIHTTRLRWASDNPTRSLNLNHHLRSKSSCPLPKFNLCYTPPWQRGTPLHQRLRLGKAPWQMWHDWIITHDGIHASGWVFFTYMNRWFLMVDVGLYTIPSMDAMGQWLIKLQTNLSRRRKCTKIFQIFSEVLEPMKNPSVN